MCSHTVCTVSACCAREPGPSLHLTTAGLFVVVLWVRRKWHSRPSLCGIHLVGGCVFVVYAWLHATCEQDNHVVMLSQVVSAESTFCQHVTWWCAYRLCRNRETYLSWAVRWAVPTAHFSNICALCSRVQSICITVAVFTGSGRLGSVKQWRSVARTICDHPSAAS